MVTLALWPARPSRAIPPLESYTDSAPQIRLICPKSSKFAGLALFLLPNRDPGENRRSRKWLPWTAVTPPESVRPRAPHPDALTEFTTYDTPQAHFLDCLRAVFEIA